MAKTRVYELARDLNLTNQILLSKLDELDISVKSHMSSLDNDAVAKVKTVIFGKKEESIEETRIKPTVIRMRRKKVPVEVVPELTLESDEIDAGELLDEEVSVAEKPDEKAAKIASEKIEPSKNLKFEVLCFDIDGSTKKKSVKNLQYSFMSDDSLWSSSNPKWESDKEIVDLDITVSTKEIVPETFDDDAPKKVFLVNVTGNYDRLQSIRLPILSHLKSTGFAKLYVLTDDVSKYIACEIYPLINNVENSLRRYIIKFFTIKLGPNWWKVTADDNMKHKVQQRKNNETTFSKYIENNSYLIDFNELGGIIYQHSSGFISKKDIIQKIYEMDESIGSIKELKENLQTNYTKFFKDTFKDKDFQNMWETLEKIRHKVAHNNLFTEDDREKTKSFSDKLLTLIREADQNIDNVVFTHDEQESIKDSLIELQQKESEIENDGDLEEIDITEEKLLEELVKREQHFKATGGYLGLSSFIHNYLVREGYSYESVKDVIEELKKKGNLEIYSEGEYKALRIVNSQK